MVSLIQDANKVQHGDYFEKHRLPTTRQLEHCSFSPWLKKTWIVPSYQSNPCGGVMSMLKKVSPGLHGRYPAAEIVRRVLLLSATLDYAPQAPNSKL